MKIPTLAAHALAGIVLLSPLRAQSITDFDDPSVVSTGGWMIGPNSLISGPTSAGPNLQGSVFSTGQGYYTINVAGLNQISLTSTGTVLPEGGTILRLRNNSGVIASAIFANSSLGSGATVTSQLVVAPGYENASFNQWDIASTFVNTGTDVNVSSGNISVTFLNATAGTGSSVAPGIGGKVITNFGTNAVYTLTNAGSYNAATSTFAPNGPGDQITGTVTPRSFVGASQVSMTASAQVAPGQTGTFNYILTDENGNQAFAAFDWSQFAGGVKTVQSTLVPGVFFDASKVKNWALVNTNQQAGITATLYGAAGLSPTQTESVVDDFTVSVSQFTVSYPSNPSASVNSTITLAGYNDAQRQIQSDISNYGNPNAQATAQVADGNYLLVTTDSQDSVNQITYSGFSLYATEQQFLRFDFNSVQNLKALAVDLGNGLLPTVSGTFTVADSEFASSSFTIDLSQLPNWTPEFASGIDSLNVIFDTPSGNMMVELDRIAFTSVPEPSTYALLALGAAFVLFRRAGKHRRRS